jgi:DNA-directed RNA polymerase specialized sigma24 family protein
MNVDEDFADFVRARWSSLYRLAYLLAASPTGAEDLLQTTLEKAYVSWHRIGRMEYPEAYVRRMLANTLVSSRRGPGTGSDRRARCRRWRGTRPSCRSSTARSSGRWCVRSRTGSGR